MELVIHNQDQRATHTSEDIGASSLEESLRTFFSGDFTEAVNGTIVQDFLFAVGGFSTGLHHESSSDGVQGVGEETGNSGDIHGIDELEEDGGILFILEEDSLSGVVATEVEGSVGDNTHHGDGEALVETSDTVGLVDFGETVQKTVELSLAFAFSDISGKSGTGEVQGVDETERSGTGSTTRGEVTEEKFERFGLGVVGAEGLLESVFEGKVQGLGGEISDHVGQVTTVEGTHTFFFEDTAEAVTDTSVAGDFARLDLGVSVLGL